jgi:tripartite-type tricarboxylate transporter receptor subunit TctC
MARRDLLAWIVIVVLVALLALLRLQRGADTADTFPRRALSIICPFAAGGGTDLFARGLARAAEAELGRTITVNNITGGGGAAGHAAGLLARPDGYTVTAITFELVSLPLQGLVPFTHEDFELLMRLNVDRATLSVPADHPARDLAEFIALAKQGGSLRIGNSGPGSVWHLAAALLADRTGLAVTHVPFGGAAPAVTALVGGHIDAVVTGPGEVRMQHAAGQVKVLAVMGAERLPLFPDVPTFREAGIDLVFGGWRGLAVPKQTPPAVRERLTTAFRAAMATPEFIELAERGGLHLDYADAAAFRQMLEAQSLEIAALMDRLGLRGK